MKALYILISIIAFNASALECEEQVGDEQITEKVEITTDVPNHLKGATITITLADGRTSSAPAEKYKVVPRQYQYLVTKVEHSRIKTCEAERLQHRVSAVGGYGPTGSVKSTSVDPITTRVDLQKGLIGGVQYQHMLNKRLSIGVQGQTNKSGSLLLGLDF